MLTINDITVRLGGRTIIDRASASLPTGARVGLIGRNGAGKSAAGQDDHRPDRAGYGRGIHAPPRASGIP
jgi:ABC-type microcin C transport system duplicated ATPase subunit YejF